MKVSGNIVQLKVIGSMSPLEVFGNIVQGGAFNWAAYWAAQSEVLFFGEVSKITGGFLYNQVQGATDYLTVTGAAGSYTFQCPNTAPYIAADTNYIWFQTDESQRTTTEAELVTYDFTRTIIKYDNTTPYAIRWIMILASDFETARENKMRDSFELSIWWSDVLSSHGNVKGNRGIGKSFWAYTAEYTLLYNAFTTKPSIPDSVIQATALTALVNGGYYAKAQLLDVFATHGNAESLFNWKNPGTHNPIAVGSPTWAQYKSYLGAAGKYIDLNFIPSTDSDVMGVDNMCWIIGSQSSADGDAAMGVFGAAYAGQTIMQPLVTTNRFGYELTSGAGDTITFEGRVKAHWGISRANNTQVLVNRNAGAYSATRNCASGSDLAAKSVHALGRNSNGTHINSTSELSFIFAFSALTQDEMTAVMQIMETYLDSYGFGLI